MTNYEEVTGLSQQSLEKLESPIRHIKSLAFKPLFKLTPIALKEFLKTLLMVRWCIFWGQSIGCERNEIFDYWCQNRFQFLRGGSLSKYLRQVFVEIRVPPLIKRRVSEVKLKIIDDFRFWKVGTFFWRGEWKQRETKMIYFWHYLLIVKEILNFCTDTFYKICYFLKWVWFLCVKKTLIIHFHTEIFNY